MPWLHFTKDFDFSPAAHKGRVTIAYKAGSKFNVTRECAAAAVAAGGGRVAAGGARSRPEEDGGDGK